VLLAGCESYKYSQTLSTPAMKTPVVQQPVSRNFDTQPQTLRAVAQSVLSEQGYAYRDGAQPGTLDTDARPLKGAAISAVGAAGHTARPSLKFEGTTLSYTVEFDKTAEPAQRNVPLPELENAMREEFFGAINVGLQRAAAAEAAANAQKAAAATAAAKNAAAAKAAPPPAPAMTVAEAQRLLARAGYRPGPADGMMGRNTIDALKKFQRAQKLPVTGEIDAETALRLRATKAASSPKAARKKTR
jgi:hypothetical protein